MSTPHVSALAIYPLKSGRGIPQERIEVGRAGMPGDRRWIVVDAEGQMVTARTAPELLRVAATPADGTLHLAAPGAPDLVVPHPVGAAYGHSVVWGTQVRGRLAGPDADAWVSQVVGRDGLQLMWCEDPTERVVDQAYAGPLDRVAYHDGFPVLLTTTASLACVQRWVDDATTGRGEQPVALDMRRFRPNVVVDGLAEPLVEQQWDRVQIGDVTFRMAKHCGRCVMTTHDPDTLARSKEPLRSIAEHNTVDGRLVFGVNLVAEGEGTLSLGDPVTAGPS